MNNCPANKTTILMLLVSACLSLFAVPTHAQQILWRADRPLTWDDFKGPRPPKSKWAATTWSQTHYRSYPTADDSLHLAVTCSFDPAKSWKKNNRLKPDLLKHEQGHFDISELYARKIRRAFKPFTAAYKYRDYTSWKLRVIFKHYARKRRRMQHKYDRLTNHSKRKNVQLEWNQKIADQLSELGAYEVR